MKLAHLALALLTCAPALAHAGARSDARESHRAPFTPETAVAFKPGDNVFVKSVLAVDFTYRTANATLPLYRGVAPDGADVYYILTDASDFEFARQLGLNYAPKVAKAGERSRSHSRPAEGQGAKPR